MRSHSRSRRGGSEDRPTVPGKESFAYGATGAPGAPHLLSAESTNPTDAISSAIDQADRQRYEEAQNPVLPSIPEDGSGSDAEGPIVTASSTSALNTSRPSTVSNTFTGEGPVAGIARMGGLKKPSVALLSNELMQASTAHFGTNQARETLPMIRGVARTPRSRVHDPSLDGPRELHPTHPRWKTPFLYSSWKDLGVGLFALFTLFAVVALVFYIVQLDPFSSANLYETSLMERVYAAEKRSDAISKDIEAMDKRLQAHKAFLTSVGLLPFDKVNHFSIGLGAVINPHLTSPTKMSPSPLVPLLSPQNWFLPSPRPRAVPPIVALQSWSDVGECWCAPPDEAKSQLGVLLGRRIAPTEIVVEHIRKGQTLDIGAAPKDIELWIRIEDFRLREIVREKFFELLPDMSSDVSRPQARPYPALDDTYVLVGRWRYDIYALNHIQTFKIHAGLDMSGFGTTAVVFRATSSWGNENYVCLYRLRLHGETRV